jgi:hypothetical protein
MYRCSSRIIAAATGVLLASALSGCTSYYADTVYDHFDRRETIARGAGDAVATDRVAQMYDPWPPASANRNLTASGPVVEAGIVRYRTGRVIQPVGIGTSSAGYGQNAGPGTAAAPAPGSVTTSATP